MLVGLSLHHVEKPRQGGDPAGVLTALLPNSASLPELTRAILALAFLLLLVQGELSAPAEDPGMGAAQDLTVARTAKGLSQ